ncbi:MAG: Structural maintenance of chromosomes protein 3 [Thelocarpon impressellum]|nr:MAG: Structural maintenance of chromosomes protein 3 [Thelocarpon impressellum]
MYIKQIIIQGFKSYKEQTVIEPFSPKHNVIVGRNGSGKSNFFAAIRFVLSDAYTQMGREERQALLHEGSGSAVMSAYVEIIFDNTDERFPTGKDELILRRTIGLKKDEYSLDRKNATKADVMNLLESAGFSRSNPYYIVPQGRVTTLTNMKDAERLNLLKEVAGTQVYEARRQESLKIMTETDNKRSKIDELLDYIKERLGELEEEKEELRGYQEKDRERRCLEYTIYHREQVEIANALDNIDEQRQTGVDESDGNRERFLAGEKAIGEIDAEINDIQQQIELLRVERRQLEDERRENARARAKVELDVKSLSDGQSQTQQAKARHDRELQEVQNAIRQREAELAQILPEFTAKRDEESAIRSHLEGADALRQRLYAKQGRNARFKSKKERDDWLKKEISEANIALATRKAIRMQTTEEVVELEKNIAALEGEVKELRGRFDGRGDRTQEMAEEVQLAKEERDRLIDQRKELWREEAKLDSVVENARQELDRAERTLSHTMDQNTSRGLAAVRRIKRQHNLDGVYGTLAELIEVNEKYRTAVEVTAGQSLFHYVVDNDETATKVLEILQREKAGRITFMPLNRLKPRPINVPSSNDAIPMMDKIKFEPRYRKAVEQVFGKTIICQNLQVAAQYARSHGVNAITPDGDRSDKKGALTGGYHDPRKSRLEAVKNVLKWRDEYEGHRSRGGDVRRGVERKDQEITRAVGELQKIEQKRQQLEGSYGPLRAELRAKATLLERQQDTLDAKRRAMDNVEASLKLLGEQLSAFETEVLSEFKKVLSKEEEQQLEELNNSAQDLRKRYSALSTSRSELEARKSIIEVELRENLRQRLDQLKGQEFENLESGSNANLKESQRELKRIGKAIDAVGRKLTEAEEAIEQASGRLAGLESSKSDTLKQQEEIARSIERHQKRMEKSMAKKALLAEKAAECSRNIRDLGVLPEEAFDKFEKMPSNTIVKRLHKVNDGLKKYSHVNKKAFEQYNNFTKQRDTLTKRRAELDSSQASIEELIEVLDQRKDEAIERTFKQVSREFADIFEKLVPAGTGRLVIQRKADRRVDEEEEDDDEHGESVENYTGVGISVSFNSKDDEQQRIQQLSGGQKSLCALALVFAIQQCDPAPFYLFDEIDANLDAQYRTAVANMLRAVAERNSQADGGQFICTTFRPEMVLVADKCYGVAYAGKTSSIDVVRREQALEFVEGQKV